MNTTMIYYTETNLICIIIAILLLERMGRLEGNASSMRKTFFSITVSAIVMSIADIVAAGLRGAMFFGSLTLLHISNGLYYLGCTFCAFAWWLYINLKCNREAGRSRGLLWRMPVILYAVLNVLNPWTGILYTFTQDHFYQRGPFIWIHWVVNWFYLISATVMAIKAHSVEKDPFQREELKPLILFAVPPFIAGTVQMFVYGVTAIQVSIIFSLLMNYLMQVQQMVSQDTLTRIYNRRYILRTLNRQFMRHHETELYISMMDVDCFKQINDQYGHLEGDHALVEVGTLLQSCCDRLGQSVLLCRYGGDEFLLIGQNVDQTAWDELEQEIKEKLKLRNETSETPYLLGLSIGHASGVCCCMDDVVNLIAEADKWMYNERRLARAAGTYGGRTL